MKTRRPQGTREWGFRLPHTEYFHFVGSRDEAVAEGRAAAFGGEFEICEGRLTWNEDERSELEVNADAEWFICVGTPEQIAPVPDPEGDKEEGAET